METMQTRIVILAVFLVALNGCATEAEKAAGAAARTEPAQSPARSYRTGSRLPSMEDDSGTSSVSGISKDDYIDDRNRSGASGVRGN